MLLSIHFSWEGTNAICLFDHLFKVAFRIRCGYSCFRIPIQFPLFQYRYRDHDYVESEYLYCLREYEQSIESNAESSLLLQGVEFSYHDAYRIPYVSALSRW